MRNWLSSTKQWILERLDQASLGDRGPTTGKEMDHPPVDLPATAI